MATPYYNDPNYYLNGPPGSNTQQNQQRLAAAAAAVGMTPQSYAQFMADNGAANPSNAQSAQTTGYGMTQSVPNQNNNSSMNQTLATLGAMQKYGLGQQQQQAPTGPPPGAVSDDPMNAASNLGAAALGERAIYNPTPNQAMMGGGQGASMAGSMGSFASGAGTGGSGFDQSGVEPVAMPTESDKVPTVAAGPWSTNAGVFTGQQSVDNTNAAKALLAQYGGDPNTTPANLATWYQGMTGKSINTAGATQQTAPTAAPGAGSQFGGFVPANAPGVAKPATPYATAPAAPGLTNAPPTATPTAAPAAPDQDPAAHNQALAHAGMALYSHFGGDPSTATPTDISNFHNQLTDHIQGVAAQMGVPSAFGAPPQAAAGYTAGIQPAGIGAMATAGIPAPGAAPGAAPGGAPPLKMADGGFVPGQMGDPMEIAPLGPGASQPGMPTGPVGTPSYPTGMPQGAPPMTPYGQPGGQPWGQGGGQNPGGPMQGGGWGQGWGQGQGQGQGGGLQASPVNTPYGFQGGTPGGGMQGHPWMRRFGNQAAPPPAAPSPLSAAGGYAGAMPQMSAGGVVPGRGSQDTVHALLTPGEYVIPKAQVQQMQNGQPLRFDEGGYVPDPKDRDRPIPRSMTGGDVQAPGSTAGGGGMQRQALPPQQQSPVTNPGSDQGQSQNANYWQNLLSKVQQQNASNAPSAIADTPSVAPSYDVASDPDPDWQYTGQESAAGATGAGGGAASGVAGAAGVASGLISGLQKAVDTYKDSIKDFQPKAQQFGNKPPPTYVAPTFKETGS
jgi:hypothetical protein